MSFDAWFEHQIFRMWEKTFVCNENKRVWYDTFILWRGICEPSHLQMIAGEKSNAEQYAQI